MCKNLRLVRIESHLRDDLARIFAEVRPTEFTGEIARRLDAIAAQSADLEALFIRIVTWLLGDRAPLFVSPRMAWVRRGAASILERELSQPGQSSRRVIEAGERLRALGFPPQLHRRPEHVNCFLHRDGVRHKLLLADGRFEIIAPTGARTTVAAADLCAQLAAAPEGFGLNVVTRPIVQDHLLPTLAAVVGPGELGYLAQMRGVYDFFDVAMPMLLPRPQVSLIEPRVERALARLGLPVESAAGSASQFESQMQNAARRTIAEDPLETARRRLDETLEYIRSEVDLSDPAVARSYERLREVTGTAFEKLRERARAAALSRDAETARAASTARDSLRPGGQPQERALNIFFPFLNLFGPRLIERLAEAIVPDAKGVQPIALSSLMAGEAKV